MTQNTLDALFEIIESRKNDDPDTSWTAKLLHTGTQLIADKVVEEADEVIVEALAQNKEKLAAESADLLYHLLVLWADGGIRPSDVWAELQRREGVSGIAEKQSRK